MCRYFQRPTLLYRVTVTVVLRITSESLHKRVSVARPSLCKEHPTFYANPSDIFELTNLNDAHSLQQVVVYSNVVTINL